MAKANKLTESAKKKLINAANVIKSFTTIETNAISSSSSKAIILPLVSVTYPTNHNNTNLSISLVIKTVGVGGNTNVSIHETGIPDIDIHPLKKGSFDNFVLGKDNALDRKFIRIVSTLSATSLTPVPADLKITITIEGGMQTKVVENYPAKYINVGDAFILETNIFFY
jgi:hypothetical protein